VAELQYELETAASNGEVLLSRVKHQSNQTAKVFRVD